MPRQNRVTPLGELIATTERGLVYGNRGCLHDDHGVIRRRFAVKRWIACRLEFRGWRRSPLLQPGRFTELFFLDEATALAAGHRPCALCRRPDYRRFSDFWRELHRNQEGADAVDTQLHVERIGSGPSGRRLHRVRLESLPDGAFVLYGREPRLVLADALLRWTPGGYTDARPRPARATALLITPPSLVELLRGDWQGLVPLLHPSASTRPNRV